MRYLFVMLFGLLAASDLVVADDREAVFGRWGGDRSILEVRPVDDGLEMVIVAMVDPNYREDEEVGVPGEPRVDIENPDESLRGRPILGLNLVSEYRFENGTWQGKIYDPESGKVYSSKMKVGDTGNLEMRGYVGIPMFGRTASFVPASSCQAHIVSMLSSAGITGVC
jgi:uncharacterized protein (DUF2147 family)